MAILPMFGFAQNKYFNANGINELAKTDCIIVVAPSSAIKSYGNCKISEDEFVKALFVNNVTVFVNGIETGFYIDLDAEPDYFMGHLACMEIDCQYRIEAGGLNG